MTDELSVRDLEVGDEVLWGDRVVPLTVTSTEVQLSGAGDWRGVRVESQQGTRYVVHEHPSADFRVKRKAPLTADRPDGYVAEGRARDFRRAD